MHTIAAFMQNVHWRTPYPRWHRHARINCADHAMPMPRTCLHCGEEEHLVLTSDEKGEVVWCQSCFRVSETPAVQPPEPATADT